MVLPSKSQEIYDEVKKIISPIYMVGGSIRDIMMEVTPKDYDFCCSYTPDEIEDAIKKSKNRHGNFRKAYGVGKKFGTMTCKVLGQVIEITTFRTEKYSNKSRHPEVEFVQDITADLGRRDFTINAMAYRDGRLIDPFGGRMDIMAESIKAVGDPQKRLKEDPLRMLRCARFASQLNFSVDQFLTGQIAKGAYRILHISKERWVDELDKLLMTPEPRDGLDLLMETKVLNYIIPELAIQKGYDQNNEYHQYDLWTHTKLTVKETPQDINLRWAALLHDIAKPFVRIEKKGSGHYYYHDYLGMDMVERLARHLKWSNERREIVKELVHSHLSNKSELREYDRKAH